jgi:hypothetical protein
VCQAAVIRSIYKYDFDAAGSSAPAWLELEERPVSEHVRAASNQIGIVPVAILLALDLQVSVGLLALIALNHTILSMQDNIDNRSRASRRYMTCAEAAARLREQPVIRKAIMAALQKA